MLGQTAFHHVDDTQWLVRPTVITPSRPRSDIPLRFLGVMRENLRTGPCVTVMPRSEQTLWVAELLLSMLLKPFDSRDRVPHSFPSPTGSSW